MTDSTNTLETLFSFYRQQSLEDSILFLLRCSYLNDCKTYEQYTEGMYKARALRELAAQYEIDKAAIAERAAKESAPHTSGNVREALAAYAHEAWSGWMRYLFEKSHKTEQGTVTIPEWAVVRWTEQMKTEYADLPDDQKPSDRDEADKILAIVERGAEQDPELFWVADLEQSDDISTVERHGLYRLCLETGVVQLELDPEGLPDDMDSDWEEVGDVRVEKPSDAIRANAQKLVEAHQAEHGHKTTLSPTPVARRWNLDGQEAASVAKFTGGAVPVYPMSTVRRHLDTLADGQDAANACGMETVAVVKELVAMMRDMQSRLNVVSNPSLDSVVFGTETAHLQDSFDTPDGPLAMDLEPGSREIGSVIEVSGSARCTPPFWKQTHGGMAMVFEHGIYELSLFNSRAQVNQGIGDINPNQSISDIKLKAQRAVEAAEKA